MAKTDVKVKIKPNTRIAEPSMYQIIYVNDDVTTMEFVITSLVRHFNHSSDTALELTQNIHDKGSAVVAVLPYEVAEQKGVEVTQEASAHGFPLKIKIESEKI
jgi:ATP-dependent Clp protease adaptor protein ClpS